MLDMAKRKVAVIKAEEQNITTTSTDLPFVCAVCDLLSEEWPYPHTPVPFIVCPRCGAPHRRITSGQADSLFKQGWLESARRYWLELGFDVAPGYGGRVEPQTDALRYALVNWLAANAASLPTEYREWPREHDGRFKD